MMDNGRSQRDWFDLMDRLDARGDAGALGEIEGLVRNQLRFRHRTLPCVTHEDLVQDVLIDLIRAWRSRRIREPERFAGFVRTLACRRLFDSLGRERRACALNGSQGLHLELEMIEIFGSDSSERKLDADRAIAKLAPESRRALEAVYRDGCTYKEAARRLGVPLGTLKRTLTRALGAVRASLAEPDAKVFAHAEAQQIDRLAS